MCGIFAYIGSRQAVQLLIAALKRLEYRGYDSSGVGIYGKPIKVRKKVGKVTNLEEACKTDEIEGTCGIAHTRWATHGKPNDVNSHPHTTKSKGIAVVHNGVIENYRALREELSNKGYQFVSETDTELLAHLVEDLRLQMPTARWSQVVAMALSLVTGAYGVVFMFDDEPDLLVGARKGSPLLLGIGDGEYMLASDASAIIEHTDKVIYLRENELVEITRSSHKIQDLGQMVRCWTLAEQSPRDSDALLDNPIVKLELSLEQIEKGGYAHFMLKEIMDQPSALRNAMRGRISQLAGSQSWQIKLGGMEKPLEGDFGGQSALQKMASAKRLIVCACGTSWHSGLIAKSALESLAKIPVEVEYASEFRYRRPLLCPDDIIIAISQSGETADTLEAIKIAKESKCLAVGIVNTVGSSIARLTDAGMYLHSGPEIGVASTKAFTGQVMALVILALEVARQRGVLSEPELDSYCDALEKVPDVIEEWLPSLSTQTKVIAKYFRLANNTLFTGCGIQFPVALEGALKLKEISYIHAEGFPAAEIKHGALTLVQNFLPVVCIAMKSDPAYARVLAYHRELKSKGAAVIVITDFDNNDFESIACFTIRCPSTKYQFEPLLVAVPLQLFAYYIADMRGCSIDQPRNLAKSVTVE
jgi:glucosamine--fructose-6-phosphate aminotransferase (isomerizing)